MPLSDLPLLVRRPAAVPLAWGRIGVGLLAVVWLSTALLQVTWHRRRGVGFDQAVAHALVATNWPRTAARTARAGLALTMVARTMGQYRLRMIAAVSASSAPPLPREGAGVGR